MTANDVELCARYVLCSLRYWPIRVLGAEITSKFIQDIISSATGNDTLRQIAYDFRLAFHVVTTCTSCIVSGQNRVFFPTPPYFVRPKPSFGIQSKFPYNDLI